MHAMRVFFPSDDPMSENHLNPEFEPTEWLIVPPTGHTGCPLEDWLGAMTEFGLEANAKRDPEGLWIHFANASIVGFVSFDKSLVEAINFELPRNTTHSQQESLRQAAKKLGWEIWDQDSDDDGNWFEDDDDD